MRRRLVPRYYNLVDSGKDTVVRMQNAEPISLYCSDETDGESLAPCWQVLEPLFRYKPDSGDVEPALATGCEPNADLTEWTCTLREGVKFHDGSTSTRTTSSPPGPRASTLRIPTTPVTPVRSSITPTCGTA